jgi:hypothetical protein
MRSKSGREEERESEVRGAVHSGEEHSTLVSYSGTEEAYQGVPKRARAARGGKRSYREDGGFAGAARWPEHVSPASALKGLDG